VLRNYFLEQNAKEREREREKERVNGACRASDDDLTETPRPLRSVVSLHDEARLM
jgi:hypothetical protein